MENIEDEIIDEIMEEVDDIIEEVTDMPVTEELPSFQVHQRSNNKLTSILINKDNNIHKFEKKIDRRTK